jgi:cytochrome bd ubiquinol oxidase subunit I
LFAAIMVGAGTLFSSFWILAANSWMQTPAGHAIVDGRFVPVSWTAIIFNPSFAYRISHTVTAFFITTGFAVLGVAAWHLKHGRHVVEARRTLGMTVVLLGLLVPLQVLLGDLHGVNTTEHQPIKIAAMEALWDTQTRAPSVLFAVPDEQGERNRFEVAIPALASLYLKHDFDAEVQGLKSVAAADRPPVVPVFFAFRVMVGLGVIMLGLILWAAVLHVRRRLFDTRSFQNACIAMIPAGFVAVIAGWTVTEVGRQPWVVQGLLRTRDAVSPSLTGADVALSLALYVVVYLIVFGAGIYYMARMARAGPPVMVEIRDARMTERPARPLSGAEA